MLANSFPKDSVKVLLATLSATKPSTLDLVTAAHDVAGYGLFMIFDGKQLIADDQETVQLKAELVNKQDEIIQAFPPFLSALLINLLKKLFEKLVK